MKTVFLFAAAAMSAVTHLPLPFSTDAADQIHPFAAAPQIEIYVLDETAGDRLGNGWYVVY